jgi:transglutaminase-like putative cysteine protease
MRLAIRHTTSYHFTEPVTYSLQRLRLTPRTSLGQSILHWGMEYTGAAEELRYEDQHHNQVTLVSVKEGAQDVAITCHGEVETRDSGGIVGRHAGHMPLWSFLRQTPLTQPGPAMLNLAEASRSSPDRIAMLHELSARILKQVRYTKGTTDTRTTGEEACAAGQGVCQDHAHVFIGIARELGVPARYVSGYLMMRRPEQDATHAWTEAWIEGLGWVGFDIANGISPDDRYVRVATGRDYRGAAPVLGISFGAITREVAVEVSVAQQQQEQQ